MPTYSMWVANEESVLAQVKDSGIPHSFGQVDGGQEIIFNTAKDFNTMWTRLFMEFYETAFHRGVTPELIDDPEEPSLGGEENF